MKRLTLPLIAILLGFSSCGLMNLKPDREIFGNFESLEWSDDYVFAATNYPQSIQVWNKETGKLVRNYYLTTNPSWAKKNGRSLWIYDMVTMGKNIWITADGIQRNLIRLNVPTGEFKFIDLDCRPIYLEICEDRGTVFAATYCDPRIGIAIRELDGDGKILHKYNVQHSDLDVSDIDGLRFRNGAAYTLCTRFSDFNVGEEEEEGYKVLKLKDGKYEFTEISKKVLYSPLPSLGAEFSGKYVSSFPLVRASANTAPVFAVLSMVRSPGLYRFLYRIENFEPLEFSYTGILVSSKKNDRAFFSVTEYNNCIYNTGRKRGGTLECARYLNTGGAEISVVQMPWGNQLYCSRFEDSSWFSKDVFTYNFDTNSWDKSGAPQIYKVDFKTNRVLIYNADGTHNIVGTL